MDNALTTSKTDETERVRKMEKEQAQQLAHLELLFELMDSDGSGTLSWSEWEAAFENDEMKKKWKLLEFGPDECNEIFRLLDNGEGEIHTADFFEGLKKMKGLAQSKDMFRVQRDLDLLKNALIGRSLGSTYRGTTMRHTMKRFNSAF